MGECNFCFTRSEIDHIDINGDTEIKMYKPLFIYRPNTANPPTTAIRLPWLCCYGTQIRLLTQQYCRLLGQASRHKLIYDDKKATFAFGQ